MLSRERTFPFDPLPRQPLEPPMRFLLPALLLSAVSLGAAEGDAPKPYVFDTCATTGEKLGEMGEPVTKVYKGQEVKFCCKGCVKGFEKDIDGNLGKLQQKAAAQATDVKAK